MTWRLAKSLDTLRTQINAAFPKRDKSSDGTIGDARHQAEHSEHNPDQNGVVRAMDISNDPAHGVVSDKIAHALIDSRDPRILYVISNRRICSSVVQPWVWRVYSGSNAHDHHFHISVVEDPKRYDDTSPWSAIGGAASAPKTDEQPAPAPVASHPATDTMRLRMGKTIIDFEARRDKAGHLAVYSLPANDGGGSYEVAGINEKYHPKEAAELRDLIRAGKFDDAERRAEEIILDYTKPAMGWTTEAGPEFYLRDCVFNRGPGGAARILQRAVGVHDDGQVGPATRAALAGIAAGDLLTKLRAAREDYERNVVGYRANFWAGLVNRWNNALAAAKAFQAEAEGTAPPSAIEHGTKWLQHSLNELGADPKLDEDGRLGKKTTAMLTAFQEENGLPGTSLPDDATISEIEKHLAALHAPAPPVPAEPAPAEPTPQPQAPPSAPRHTLAGNIRSIFKRIFG